MASSASPRRRRDGRADAVARLERAFGISMALGTALIGAALGLLPDVLTVTDGFFARRVGIMSTFAVLGTAALCLAGVAWFRRGRLLQRRGSLYVVDADAQEWDSDSAKRRFFDSVDQQFARVLDVPGPNDLESEWKWPAEPPGMSLWSGGVDDLVLTFRALQRGDNQSTANNVVAWLPWPAAIAFPARLTQADRGLDLEIRQRPSGGRQGMFNVDAHAHRGHSFDRRAPYGESRALEIRRSARVTFHPGETPARAGVRARNAPVPARRVRVLLLRTTSHPWGPVPFDAPDTAAVTPVELEIVDHLGLGLDTADAELLEWRWVPDAERKQRFHPWSDFPALCHHAVDWVIANALPVNEGVTLLGALLPQEVSLGIGLDCLRTGGWPHHLYPLYRPKGKPMSIPGLDLGADSLRRTPKVPRWS